MRHYKSNNFFNHFYNDVIWGLSGDGFNCEDINECQLKTYSCSKNAACFNTKGTYLCSCNAGFYGEGEECFDIDECTGEHNCDVNAKCENSFGNFNCICNDGYEGDGKLCYDNDECKLEPCQANADCLNRWNFFDWHV